MLTYQQLNAHNDITRKLIEKEQQKVQLPFQKMTQKEKVGQKPSKMLFQLKAICPQPFQELL